MGKKGVTNSENANEKEKRNICSTYDRPRVNTSKIQRAHMK